MRWVAGRVLRGFWEGVVLLGISPELIFVQLRLVSPAPLKPALPQMIGWGMFWVIYELAGGTLPRETPKFPPQMRTQIRESQSSRRPD